jgi:hypothetical protein
MTIDVDTDLAHQLTDRLDRIADSAPRTSVDLGHVVTGARRADRRRRAAGLVGSATLVVAAIGGLALVQRASDDAVPADGPTVIDAPVTAFEPTTVMGGVIAPGAVGIELADTRRITFALVGMVFYDGYRDAYKIELGGHGVGMFVENSASFDRSEVFEEVGALGDVVYWSGFSPDAVTVEYRATDGVTLRSQAVAGHAAFVVALRAPGDELVALDASGAVVSSARWSETVLISSSGTDDTDQMNWYSSRPQPTDYGPIDVEAIADLDGEENQEMERTGNQAMRACLDGGTAWTACIQEADAAVKAFLADR